MTSPPLANASRRHIRTVVIAGALLGVVDGICAVLINVLVFHQTSAARTFQGVAYALIGPPALGGGTSTAILGLFMHFAVAFTWVILYFLIYDHSTTLRRIVWGKAGFAKIGPVVGAVIWLAMNFIVFPMTRLPLPSVTSLAFQVYLIQHIIIVGPLIVASTR